MSDLVKALESRADGVEREPCALDAILNKMDDGERTAVLKSLDLIRNDTRRGKAKVYSCAWLSKVLTKHGYPISRTAIRRYLSKGTNS